VSRYETTNSLGFKSEPFEVEGWGGLNGSTGSISVVMRMTREHLGSSDVDFSDKSTHEFSQKTTLDSFTKTKLSVVNLSLNQKISSLLTKKKFEFLSWIPGANTALLVHKPIRGTEKIYALLKNVDSEDPTILSLEWGFSHTITYEGNILIQSTSSSESATVASLFDKDGILIRSLEVESHWTQTAPQPNAEYYWRQEIRIKDGEGHIIHSANQELRNLLIIPSDPTIQKVSPDLNLLLTNYYLKPYVLIKIDSGDFIKNPSLDKYPELDAIGIERLNTSSDNKYSLEILNLDSEWTIKITYNVQNFRKENTISDTGCGHHEEILTSWTISYSIEATNNLGERMFQEGKLVRDAGGGTCFEHKFEW